MEALFEALRLVAAGSSGALEARYLLVAALGQRMQAEVASAQQHCGPFPVRAVLAEGLWEGPCC